MEREVVVTGASLAQLAAATGTARVTLGGGKKGHTHCWWWAGVGGKCQHSHFVAKQWCPHALCRSGVYSVGSGVEGSSSSAARVVVYY